MRLLKRIDVNSEKNIVRLGLRKIRFSYLGRNVRFGGVSVFNRAENMEIGDDVFFGSDCYFEAVSKIEVGTGCMFGPRVFCISGSHNYGSPDLKAVPYDDRQVDLPIVIERNVWVAGNVSIAPGTHIGEGSVIGMGAVVAGEIPPYSIVVGQKGRVIKTRDVEQYKELVAKEMIYNKVFAGKPFVMMDN